MKVPLHTICSRAPQSVAVAQRPLAWLCLASLLVCLVVQPVRPAPGAHSKSRLTPGKLLRCALPGDTSDNAPVAGTLPVVGLALRLSTSSHAGAPLRLSQPAIRVPRTASN